MAIRYVFREDSILPLQNGKDADAQKIGEALSAIAERSGGHLLPNAVVQTARDKRSVLHPHFEWQDNLAAEKYRLDQARAIIQSIRITDPRAEEGTIRAFISIREGASGTSYRSLDSVMSSADLQARVLAAAERDLLAFETRYRDLSEICDLIRTAREKVSERRKAAEKRPAEIRRS